MKGISFETAKRDDGLVLKMSVLDVTTTRNSWTVVFERPVASEFEAEMTIDAIERTLSWHISQSQQVKYCLSRIEKMQANYAINKRYIRHCDACEKYNIRPSHLTKLIKSKKIRAVRQNGAVYVRKADISKLEKETK